MIWTILTGLATLVSTVAYIITVLYLRTQMLALEKERYLTVTSELFALWQSREFMHDQLWLLHKLESTTWEEFVKSHRGDMGELAFHRVGSFYDRVGTLVRLGLIDDKEVLSTMGGYVIAVWQKIGPLVREARRIENSVLFDDFERLLPTCYECYVPALGQGAGVTPFSPTQSTLRIRQATLQRRLQNQEPLLVLDVRHASQVEEQPRTLPGAVWIPVEEIETRYTELPTNREVVVYCA